MSQRNDDFFKQKKEWSKTKDQLLGYYLTPYATKIFHTKRPVCYIDCFAGQGKFEDGNPGSPIIAFDIIKERLNLSKAENVKIEMYFIELNHANVLEENLTEYNDNNINYNVISGKFEDSIEDILSQKEGYNIFLYIDPYGIKAIEPNLFKKIATSNNFYSCEMLINVNTYGILRECCRILDVHFEYDKELEKFIVEYEPSDIASIEEMNRIAGGDYWMDIIKNYKKGKISFCDAEKLFSSKFCETLSSNGFKYVLNMPIYASNTNRNPKYRLIFGTNYNEGCILMADNMLMRSDEQRLNNNEGQLVLFDYDCNDNILNNDELKNNLLTVLSTDFVRLNDVIAKYYVKYGIQCKSKQLVQCIKDLNNLIEIKRDPEYTTKGKLSRFYSDDSKNKFWLRVK